eukprot:TRINITY_DN773186_c0_g1_i1.p1 TRINITY_DN773186_c0_g1~~TRINITY_DN773186_c0_g1_i1.p1  ORF type:complete len:211 (-),score=82.64 TRINITY_DN773186_c0_g1_i1:123-755(-)
MEEYLLKVKELVHFEEAVDYLTPIWREKVEPTVVDLISEYPNIIPAFWIINGAILVILVIVCIFRLSGKSKQAKKLLEEKQQEEVEPEIEEAEEKSVETEAEHKEEENKEKVVEVVESEETESTKEQESEDIETEEGVEESKEEDSSIDFDEEIADETLPPLSKRHTIASVNEYETKVEEPVLVKTETETFQKKKRRSTRTKKPVDRLVL